MRQFTLLLVGCLLATPLFAQTIYYVKPSGSDGADGKSWAQAFQTLQKALVSAGNNSQIWVAAGTYKPTADASGNTNPNDVRSKTFVMKNGVAIYGGFAGVETEISQRDWQTNETILSGDLNGDDIISTEFAYGINNNFENSYRVIMNGYTSTNSLTSSAVLDGFSIIGGNTYAESALHFPSGFSSMGYGAGMLNVYASPTINNCSFLYNQSQSKSGGGMANFGSSPTITNCLFQRNYSDGDGGGIYNEYSTPTLVDCRFLNNYCGNKGGGMDNVASSPILINCSFLGNRANNVGGGMGNNGGSSASLTNCSFLGNYAGGPGGIAGGGMFNERSSPTLTNCTFTRNRSNGTLYTDGAILNIDNSSPILANCILWGNISTGFTNGEIANVNNSNPIVSYSIVQGGYPGTGNLDVDPLFVDAATSNLRLQACSPAIDAGSDLVNTTTTDVDGERRRVDYYTGGSQIDMGANEYQQVLSTWYYDADGDGHAITSTQSCSQPAGEGWSTTVKPMDDCKDDDNTIYPGAPELCDGKDNNCNNVVDEGVGQTYYRDADGDGYGNTAVSQQACKAPTGFVSNNTDCDDGNVNIHSAKTYYPDVDGDGYGDGAKPAPFCSATTPPGYVINNFDSNDGDGKTKIFVCHSGKTLVVNAASLQAHLDHGDYGGQCKASSTTLRTFASTETAADAYHMELGSRNKFTLTGYPNPFTNFTRIQYSLPLDASISIKLFDITGREVSAIFSGNRTAGTYFADYNSAKLSGGVYYARIVATAKGQTFIQTQKLIKVK